MHTLPVLALGIALVATAAFAAPLEETVEARPSKCMSFYDAQVVANQFATLISDYSASLAELVIADDYTDQSDSVNTLIDNGTTTPVELGALIFSSKQAFMNGQGSQPSIPFTILDLWHTCDTTIIRWVSQQSPQQVQGFTALEVCPGGPKGINFQIRTTYAEFNSGAWLANLGRPEYK